MNAMDRSLVPLQQANLCLDCDIISTGHTYCFACGSTALLNLARTLDGRDYANSVPGALASLSAGAELEARDTPCHKLRRAPQTAARSAPHLQAFSDRDEDEGHPWSSLRGVAAVAQRAITIVIAVFALGLCTQATIPHHSVSSVSADLSMSCNPATSSVTIE
jgi:hypothetical protein